MFEQLILLGFGVMAMSLRPMIFIRQRLPMTAKNASGERGEGVGLDQRKMARAACIGVGSGSTGHGNKIKGEIDAMNIQQATKQAIAEGKQMTRRNTWWGIGKCRIKIKPTDTVDCCVVTDGKKGSPRWNPQAEDLIADDWIVTE